MCRTSDFFPSSEENSTLLRTGNIHPQSSPPNNLGQASRQTVSGHRLTGCTRHDLPIYKGPSRRPLQASGRPAPPPQRPQAILFVEKTAPDLVFQNFLVYLYPTRETNHETVRFCILLLLLFLLSQRKKRERMHRVTPRTESSKQRILT